MTAPVSPGMIRTATGVPLPLVPLPKRGDALMFVCLCTGATSHVVADVVASGACTSKEVAEACGAGADCGCCRRTVRAIIAAAAQVNAGAAC